VHQLKIYKNSLNPKAKKAMSKDFALQITNYFNTPITKINPPYFETLYFLHFLFFFSDIHGYKCIKWVITRSLNSKNNEGMPKDFKLVDTLNVQSPTYLCCSQQHHNLSHIHENVGLFGI
jgi:tRNA 2-selenouridine synthase SelU